ncbi:hypothetical protein C0995_006843 [Termitomyces sp. Mi166|nr:hypothetical protein C0995_006843 [Termitomyces sp. Mi166\
MPASFAPPLQPRDAYPMTSYEAEQCWEFERQRIRNYNAGLPSSSFEKTKFEDDECFYATFPRARQAAIDFWIVKRYPLSRWAQSLVAVNHDSNNLTYNLSLDLHAPISSHVPVPVVNFTTYTLDTALNVPSSSSNASTDKAMPKAPGPMPPQAPPMPAIHYNYNGNTISFDPDNGANSIPTVVLGMPGMPSYDNVDDDVLHTLRVLVPGRRASKKTGKSHIHSPPSSQKQRNIYPSTSPTSSISTFDIPSSLPTPSRSLSSQPTIVPSNAPRISNWETDAMATAEYLAMSTEKNPTISIPVPALPLSPIKPCIVASLSPPRRHRRAPRQRPHPYSPPPRRSSSPECSTSVSPPNKRSKVTRDKNVKPKMACLSCRSRKIACGPPMMGSSDPSCNQCARRGLKCEYPSIDRRASSTRKNLSVRARDISFEPSSSSCQL